MTTLLQKLEEAAKAATPNQLTLISAATILALCERERRRDALVEELVKEMSAWKEMSDCILEIIKTEDFAKDDLWIPTIQAHAQVISWDTESALAKSASFTAKDASL